MKDIYGFLLFIRSVLNTPMEDMVELEDEATNNWVPILEGQAKEIKSLSNEVKEMKAENKIRRLQDSYRFAEIAEAEDYKLNVANSNRVMITGNY